MGRVARWLSGGVDPVAVVAGAGKAATDLVSIDGFDGYYNEFPEPYTVNSTNGIPVELIMSQIRGLPPGEMYRTQDSIRAVTGFLSRNQAQVPLHIYDRVGDTDRKRITSGPLPTLIRRPNRTTYQYAFMNASYMDFLLHDNTYIWLRPDAERSDGCPWSMWRLPAEWVTGPVGGTLLGGPDSFRVVFPGRPYTDIPAEQIIHVHGYSPSSVRLGCSPIDALKATLAEQVAASTYRLQRWEKGPQVSGVLTRPAGAPRWSETAESRFTESWREQYSGKNGTNVAGTPILQDGMTYQQLGWTAEEDQFIEGSKLARITVAAGYYLNPIFVGYLDNANYSNTVIFRQMLYGQTLGPSFADWEGALNAALIERLGLPDSYYLEFNVAAFLKASFEEQAQVMTSAIGGPWLTRNEGRAMYNRPAIDGADELIVPLNVTEGGQPAPNVPIGGGTEESSGKVTQMSRGTKVGRPEVKAKPTEADRKDMEDTLVGFFGRQGKTVLSRLGASDPVWWDTDRWDQELAADLTATGVPLTEKYGQQVVDELGAEQDYDTARVTPFLAAVMGSRAGLINAATKRLLVDALMDPDKVPADVFADAKSNRAPAGGRSLTTTVAGLSTEEAAKQVYPEPQNPATKTWRTRSAHPRAAHAAMNGQTVGVFEKFSNGADWPGDAVLGPDGVSNCKCIITVQGPEE